MLQVSVNAEPDATVPATEATAATTVKQEAPAEATESAGAEADVKVAFGSHFQFS